MSPRGRPVSREVTSRQRETLEAIRAIMADRGLPPTIQELSRIMKIAPASVYQQLKQLSRKGCLRRERRKARSMEIIAPPISSTQDLVAVPILGAVPAGRPVMAEENKTGELLVDRSAVRSGPHFALKVVGDSMTGAGINNADYIVVRQQPVAENRDIVVARLKDDEVTVKRLRLHSEGAELQPENPAFQAIKLGRDDEIQILGKVVAVRRHESAEE